MEFIELKNCLDYFVDKYNVPGVDCIVRKEHKTVFRYFTGMRDIENNIKMNGNELYLIFSMTKLITCAAALQLFEKGKYSMDTPIFEFLPEFENMKISLSEHDVQESSKITTGSCFGENTKTKSAGYAKNKITVKDLFTMSAGLDYAIYEDAITNALTEGKKTTRELVSAIAKKTLCFEPGTRFMYSLCHDVLGALIEVWSGEKFGEYLENHIFKPLNMKSTFFGLPKDESNLNRMAARYTFDEERKPIRLPLECVYNLSDEYESGGAGLTSCAEDYSIFLDALACGGVSENGERILSPETVAYMGSNHLKGKQIEDFYALRPGYGYGLGVRTHIDNTISGSLSPIGEFGWDGAAGAFSLVDTKNKISLTYFQHIHNWDIKMQTDIKNALYSCI